MEKKQRQHIDPQNRRRWPWIVAIGLLLIIIGGRLSLKTGIVHNFVRDQAIKAANNTLNGQLQIGQIQGDLWKEIRVVDIHITTPDTIVRADTLYARYDLLSYFSSEFQVEEVRAENPWFSVVQNKEGSLNLQKLVKVSPEPDSTEATPFFFKIDQFSINSGRIKGQIHSLGVDSMFTVRNLTLGGGIAYRGDQYDVQLRELDFQVNQTRLPPVEVNTVAQATEQHVTLEKLVVGTGRSVLESSARVSTADSAASFSFSANPLSWRDLSAYLDPFPLQQDLQVDLSLSGNLQAFEAGLVAEANGLREFNLQTDFRWDESLSLHEAELSIDQLDLPVLLGDSTYPRMESIRFTTSGRMDIAKMEEGELKGRFSVDDISQGVYMLDSLDGSYSVRQQDLQADIAITRSKENVQVELQASEIWSELPAFTARLTAKNIQPEYWTGDTTYAGAINLTARFDGKGFQPGKQDWTYELDLKDSNIGGQQLSLASLRGTINGQRFSTRSHVRLRQSEFKLQAEVANYAEIPEYNYDLVVNRLNLAECKGFEDLPTAINARIKGEGKYISPEELQLSSTVRIDSSIVNKEFIEELQTDIQVRDTVAQITNGRLRSAIADGNFNARFHLKRWYDIQNSVDLDFQVKDVQTFAALAGVQTLQTNGNISGELRPVYEDELQFTGSIDFENVVYGDMLSSERVQGSVEVLLQEHPEYVLNLDLNNPVISSVVLQDFATTVRGVIEADSTHGNIQLMFSSPNDSRIQHFATYEIGPQNSLIRTLELQIISDLRRLTLSEPFDVEIRQQSFSMDTARLASDDGALLEAAVPYADSTFQRGYLRGQNLNMTVIQNTLLNESFFEGTLSGRIYIERQGTALSSSGDLIIKDLVYEGTALDSLDMRYMIENERLEGGLLLYDGAERLARGQLRVPFKIGDPNTFGDTFFEEEIFGVLEVRELALSRFQQMLTEAGITNTSGLARFEGRLRGTAGQPEMDASFRLRNASISGVAVDSARATFDYNHAERSLTMNSSIISLKQKAAEITAAVPIYLDLKDFNVILPGQDDSIQVDITTNQFNVASLNDFVDRTELREIQGRLDGRVSITGPMKELSANGKLNFQKGAVRVMEAGVKISDIRSVIHFNGSEVQVEQIRAQSGTGSFRASGSMKFDELQPGALNMKMVAENFRVVNTPEYNAIIDMNTSLSGTLMKPELKGELSFVSGFIYLQNFGEKSVESVELDSLEQEADFEYTPYDSLSLDLDVSFNRRFYVRNRRYLDLEYELEGQVDLLKNRGEDLQMFGALEAATGYARPLGKRFQLEEGVITFRGDPTNPELNVRHIFEPPQQELGDVRIWYIIEGTVESPKFKYESEPPMGLADIISYTLFGKPFLSLDPWKQVVANSGNNTGAADVAMDVLLDKVETLATQRLGIDVVQIDNTRSGANTGTSIKTGWYLNPKVFFAIQNEITGSTPDTIFILEYLLKKNLKLIITQGSDSQGGIDIRWNHDY
ncbi:translocation/assembly module TamB [Aliifodinibius sp. S!AR15-10]|uniref:translocation/assembly module TamB domain-containing protein n=1 Tax=Aliifodinibius sp. S!AR15-10 TaxID=2950437 RepID=UPI0028654505|nr:translocation/assembly module TamB domain-containing protein [Aliifodinibius sp. S!AR15-10]MDR8391242.1 translocation/assembly module TamB [Aliifodinibius sp. S!AR15-10]